MKTEDGIEITVKVLCPGWIQLWIGSISVCLTSAEARLMARQLLKKEQELDCLAIIDQIRGIGDE